MQPSSRFFVLSLLVAALAQPTETLAARPEPAPLLRPATPAAGVVPDRGAVRTRTVTVDFPLLFETADRWTRTGAPVRPLILLNLFPDVRRVARFETLRSETPDTLSLIGRIPGAPDSYVNLTFREDVLIGTVDTGEAVYRIRFARGDRHLVQEIDPSALPPEAEPLYPDLGLAGLGRKGAALVQKADSGDVIRVLVMFTPAAVSGAGSESAMQTEVAAAVADANTAYANSNVSTSIELVGSGGTVSYTETGSCSTELGRLRAKNDGYLDSMHSTRDLTKADLVALITNNTTTACGCAYIMTTESTSFEAWAFSITDRGCFFQYTFAHELGHNMGCAHAPGDPGSSGVFSYSFGYKDATHGFRTVMAYPCSGSTCNRVRHFSSPSVTYNGWATGTSSQNNALTINNTRDTVANFRQGKTELPPPPPL